jgi:hypothetical protein
MVEKLLIQKVSPFVPLEHIHNGIMGLKGHVCAFEQNLNEIVTVLPRLPSNVSFVRVIREMKSEIGASTLSTTKAYTVNRWNIMSALLWLKKYNVEYRDIFIQESNLDWLNGSDEAVFSGCDVKISQDDDDDDNLPGSHDLGPNGLPLEKLSSQQFGYVDSGSLLHSTPQVADQKRGLLITLQTHAKKRKIEINWPSTDQKAVHEFDDVKLFLAAFPWLFPGGIGDISECDTKHISEWGSNIVKYFDGRFLKDPVFVFYANNYITRRLNSSSGKWFVESFHTNAPESLSELKDTIRSGDMTFIRSLTYSSKRVKGSSQYWFQKRSELYSWVNHHIEAGNGVPNFFITLSCAENYWPDIIRLVQERMTIAGDDVSQCYLGSPKMSKILNDYSIVVQEYFQIRVKAWFETVGKSVFDIQHYWARYEFAPGRGQIHTHVLGISSDKKLWELSCFGDGNLKSAELAEYARNKYGLTASMEITDSTENDSIAALNSRFSSLPSEEYEKDASHLMQKCQIHQCSKFCMRNGVCKIGCGKEQTKGKCDTPGFPLRKDASIEKDHRGITKLFLSRNNSRLNQTSKIALQSWRANCDVQILLYKCSSTSPDISEIAGVVDYVIAYSCKGNATQKEELKMTRDLVMNATEFTGCKRDITRVCRQVLNNTIGRRLISKQEATVMLTNLPLFHCTETVENVSVSYSKSIGDSTSANRSGSILTMYSKRLNGIENGTPLHQFASCISLYDYFHLMKNVLPPQKKLKTMQHFYQMFLESGKAKSLLQFFVGKKYKVHPNAAQYVIPNFVGIKTAPCFPVSDQYARAVLTIYKPWFTIPSPEQNWKIEFNSFVNSRYCPKSVKLAYSRVMMRHYNGTTHIEPKTKEGPIHAQVISEEDRHTIDLFGLASKQDMNLDDSNEIADLPRGMDYDWTGISPKSRNHPSDDMDIPPQDWLYAKVDLSHHTQCELKIPKRDDGSYFMHADLYPDQQAIFYHVMGKIKEFVTSNGVPTSPLHLTINGPGGSGKSVLILTLVSALRRMFQSNTVCQVATPTGSSAFNVQGETVHRLGLMGLGKEEAMSKSKREQLLKKFSDLLCLIIDERSLLSASDLGRVEKRISDTIHTSQGQRDQLFGGLPVLILVGDDYQLPAQNGIIQNMDRTRMDVNTARGMQIFWECANTVMVLQTSRRMADSNKDQKILLNKVRLGAMDLTSNEVHKLQSLRLENIKRKHGQMVHDEIMRKSVFLFYTNDKKDKQNMKMLRNHSNETNPVAVVKPRSSGPRAGRAVARHFPNSKSPLCAFLCRGAKVAIDAINYNPLWGLYNGACGTVQEIVFLKPGSNPNGGDIPDYVVVDFPSYTGPPWDINNPTHVPIPKAKHFCNTKCCNREFIPLVLAWAITTHRFQGQSAGPVDSGKIPNSYESIVFDPHDSSAEQKHLGLFYTGLSRATTLGDEQGLNSAIYFTGNDATESRMSNIGRKKNSRDYYDSYVKRSKWVQHLAGNVYVGSMTGDKKEELCKWIDSTSYEEDFIPRLVLQWNMI